MKIVRCHVLLLPMLVFAVIGCQKSSPSTPTSPETSESQSADTETAHESDASPATSKQIFIDVRSQEEWDSGHLPDAVWIPHTEIAERIGEVTEDKSAKLVLY